MSDYFSSQTTIQNKVISLKIRLMADKNRDGTADEDTLNQAFSMARETIVAMLTPRYGSQVDDWTFDDVPTLIQHISDDLVLYELAGGTPNVPPVILSNNERAMKMLEMLSIPDIQGNYRMSLPGVSDSSDYDTYTDKYTSDFNDDETEEEEESNDPEFFPR